MQGSNFDGSTQRQIPRESYERGEELQTRARNKNIVVNFVQLQEEEKIMKKYIYLGLFIPVILVSGCLELPMIKSSPKKTEQGLYTKVPKAMQAGVREAEYDLKKAKAQVDLASEKVKLAQMRKDMAILEKDYADFEMKMAETLVKEAEVELERKKLEAVDNSNLGDKEDNIKRIANLKKQELNVESENIQIKAELDILNMKIKKLAKEIKAKKTQLAKKK
jgi:hypothetical protein